MATMKSKRFVLDEYQKKVLTYVANGENLFVTGKAGTGKTALLLHKLLPKKLIPVVLDRAGIPHHTKCNVLTSEQRRSLLETLKDLPCIVSFAFH